MLRMNNKKIKEILKINPRQISIFFMKFAVGYQLFNDGEESFTDIVNDFSNHISEVFFPWTDEPSCRASLSERNGFTDWSAQEQLIYELAEIRQKGVKLDLLFNANCYGGKAVSKYLENRVRSIIEYLGETTGGISIATTTSPAIAHIIKKHFPEIEVRASVNMRIGTVKGMQYLSDLFDSFHIQRDYNRDFERIEELKEWTDSNGKKLIMLANSGCLKFCSGQTFHDNMVAHEIDIDETVNMSEWNPHTCWRLFKDRKNWVCLLQNTWIRPEDIHHYDKYFDTVKLATRMHCRPAMVIRAYAERKYYGNLLDLCEPGFGPAIAPWIIDNSKFPPDWFEKTSGCAGKCHKCSYCESVLEKVLVKIQE